MISNEIAILIAVVIAMALAIALIVLYKRRVIDADVIQGISGVFQTLPVTEGKGVFGMIREYAQTAVQTVEQLVKIGAISRDDATRKDKAMDIVAQAARIDEVPFGTAEQDMASYCIEAEVQQLPRNQKPPDDAAE